MNRNGFVGVCAAAFFGAVLGFAYGATFNRGCGAMLPAGAVAGCAEFVLFRYQTLIGIGGGIIAALITVAPAWRQLVEMSRQTEVQTLDHLRQRSVELEREDNLIFEIGRSLSAIMRAIKKNESPDGGYFRDPNIFRNIDGTGERLKKAIADYVQNVGPLWGTQQMFTLRIHIKEQSEIFSAQLDTYKVEFASALITKKRVDEIAKWLTGQRTLIVRFLRETHNANFRERQNVARRIGEIEKRLYSDGGAIRI